MKINNLKFSKRMLAGMLAVGTIGLGIFGMKLHKDNEVRRVKNYLSDFVTSDNYVDLSKISTDYVIKDFSGEILKEALEDMDVDYVRITDSYIYDASHVETFKQMHAVNYDCILGELYGKTVYEMYEPIRNISDSGVAYCIPEGFVLEEIEVVAEPIRYDDLIGREVVVLENDYEDSYSLELKKR